MKRRRTTTAKENRTPITTKKTEKLNLESFKKLPHNKNIFLYLSAPFHVFLKAVLTLQSQKPLKTTRSS
jgi:hypothetical protein